MKQLVIMPGGFHPFHAGHLALYQSALEAFPGADVKVAATNDTSNRPFPFKLKEKLAQLAGVPPGDFYQVKSPFRAEEITKNYDPADTQLIFVRSEKDADKPPRPGGIKKDGTPGYLQPVSDRMAPMTQHAYMAYLPTVTFGPGMRSATEIRTAWPELDERRRMALVMSLYPNTQKNPKLANTVVKMLDTAMGAELTEVLDTKASTATSQWDTSDPDMIKFNFTASNGVRYQLDFLEPYIGPDEMSPYDFFDSDEVYNKSKFVSFEQITQDMKGGHPVAKQGIEGTGSAAEVFGIVINAIIQYVKKARPALLYFQAAEPNRRALYARIIRRILPDLPGWDSTADDAGQFAIYNRRAIKSAMSAEVAEGLTDTDGPGVSFDSAEGFKNTIRQKLGRSDPELNTNIDQLVVADPDGTVDVDQTLFNMLKEFDELMPQILQFVKDITAKFIETSQSIEFQQASPADQQSLLQSTKDMQAMLPGLEKQVADARAKFQQNAPIMQQNIQTKAAAAKPVPPVVKEVTRQMSQGGLRASYQRKYNQPMMEDYLDEARS